MVVVTGGPGGGKSALLADIGRDPIFTGRVVILPEAIHAAVRSSVSPSEMAFQRLVVNLQKGIEQAVADTFRRDDHVLLSHRGTLDPLAFCLAKGWKEEDFWEITGLCREEEYHRYHGVIHMVSTAIGAREFYRYRPEEHRPETPEEAARLDTHLARIWGQHPRYCRIENDSMVWSNKSRAARSVLQRMLAEER